MSAHSAHSRRRRRPERGGGLRSRALVLLLPPLVLAAVLAGRSLRGTAEMPAAVAVRQMPAASVAEVPDPTLRKMIGRFADAARKRSGRR